MPTQSGAPGGIVPAKTDLRQRWVLVFMLLGAVIAVLSIVAFFEREPAVIYAFSVDEALARHARGEPHERLRISGVLVPGSLARSDESDRVSFQLRSVGDRAQRVFVRAACVVPISDRDAERPVELSVEGGWSDAAGPAHFAADRVLVKWSRAAMWEGKLAPVWVRERDAGVHQ